MLMKKDFGMQLIIQRLFSSDRQETFDFSIFLFQVIERLKRKGEARGHERENMTSQYKM